MLRSDDTGRFVSPKANLTDFSYDMLPNDHYRVRLLGTDLATEFHLPDALFKDLLKRVHEEAQKLRDLRATGG